MRPHPWLHISLWCGLYLACLGEKHSTAAAAWHASVKSKARAAWHALVNTPEGLFDSAGFMTSAPRPALALPCLPFCLRAVEGHSTPGGYSSKAVKPIALAKCMQIAQVGAGGRDPPQQRAGWHSGGY